VRAKQGCEFGVICLGVVLFCERDFGVACDFWARCMVFGIAWQQIA